MKKYMKLIGSLMIMICMAVGIFFSVTDSQAAEDTRLWLTDYTVDENGVPSHEGYLFAGYYEETEDTYTAIKSIEGLPAGSYCAKFVPKDVLGIKAQVSGNILKNEVSDTSKNMIRFVTSIDDSLDYKKVGFKINVGGYVNIDAEVDEYVFEKIYAVGATEETQEVYVPSIFDNASKYFKTWTFTDVPEEYLNTDITVTPYWVTLDGTTVEGTTAIRTGNYCRSWYYVDSTGTVTNSAAPVGTYSNPYTTLANAVAVETELDPKLILKSDVTIDATVSVARTMTIEGLDTAKTVTYNDTTNNLFAITTDGDLTLNKLALSGGNSAVRNEGGKVAATNVTIQGTTYCGVYVDNSGYANLNNLTITGGERGIQLYTGGDVDGNVVTINGPITHGIACGASSFDITGLTISGNTGHAINVYGGSTAKVTTGEIKESTGGNSVNVAASTATLTDVDITFATTATGAWEGVKAYKENDVAATVNLSDVTITNAPERGIQVAGSSVYLTNVQINGSTKENLYLNNASSATINGTLTTQGGTHSLAVYGASTVNKGTNYDKIEISGQSNGSNACVRVYDPNSKLQVGNIDMAGGYYGIEMGNGASLELQGTTNIKSSAFNAIHMNAGTLNATTINIQNAGNYGFRTYSGITTIDELNINGAKAYSAIYIQGTSTQVTINSGTIQNSTQNGINVKETATLNLSNYTILGIGSQYFTIQNEGGNAKINLNNVTPDTIK